MKKRALFIDRDGTIIVEPQDTQQIDSLERLDFIPGAITALARIARFGAYELVMVTNQDGLGTASFPEETFWPAHDKMTSILAGEGIAFREVLIDRSFAHENKPTRKPGTAMLAHYLLGDYDLAGSFVIGDRVTDLTLAKNIGAKGILIGSEPHPDAVLTTLSWQEIANEVIGACYRCHRERVTKETSISLDLALYGSDKIAIDTGIGFFDHMLTLLTHHAGFDLTIKAKGDLHVDEHHLVEDVGIALGECLSGALVSKVGITRYGFVLPMDESRATVAIDLSGRSHLEWNAEFKRERVGDLPTEMFKHFFKSFTDAARCALHIEVHGENEHHKIEAIFKAVGRTLRAALTRDPHTTVLPSTKGLL